jgi:RNA polymerase sigma-70 factor, ECF subfamily
VFQLSSTRTRELAASCQAGDDGTLHTLIPLVYGDLHRLARHYLKSERPDHTLQTTELVHEAYLRLIQQDGFHCENRAHLLAVSAQLMRQILVECARRRRAAKRDGGYRVTLNGAEPLLKESAVDLMALDDALQDLARLDSRQSRVVELRYFGGLTVEETAEALKISPATVRREWTTAKLWLRHEMREG